MAGRESTLDARTTWWLNILGRLKREQTIEQAAAIASTWASRFVRTLLFAVEPGDTTTLVGAIVVLTVIGGVAALVPAVRAARVDPATVLRES